MRVDTKLGGRDLPGGTQSLGVGLSISRSGSMRRDGSLVTASSSILQGMDTSGKGGTIRHVMGQVDPQGVSIRRSAPDTR